MIVQWWMFLFFLILVLFTSVVFANPFDSFENELRDYIDSENNQNSELDPELRDLFQPDNTDENFDFKKSNGGLNFKLPSHINVSRLISTTIIKSEKKASTTYKVKPKDTLSTIASQYNTKVENIKSLNNLKSDNIRVGQVLNLTQQKNTNSQYDLQNESFCPTRCIGQGNFQIWIQKRSIQS